VRLALLAFLGTALASGAEVIITFAPQTEITDKVFLWSARACPPKAVSITTVYALASYRGIPWMEPATAERLLSKKSWQGRAMRWAGYAAAGAAYFLTGTVKASQQIQIGVTAGAGLLNVLVPLVAKDAPRVDPNVGRSLMLDTDGCGVTLFYAHPSNVVGFNEVLP